MILSYRFAGSRRFFINRQSTTVNGPEQTADAKRLRQFFEDVLPENIDDLVKNLNEYRKTIKGDFEEKVETLNEFTKGLIEKKES